MIDLGVTSHIIVTGLLAISQLIEPVPDSVVSEKTVEYQNSSSCAEFARLEREFEKERCERLRRNKRRFRESCAGLETDKNNFEVKCANDKVTPKVLAFRPKPLDEYYKMSNQDLVNELNVICLALQDRAFLSREDWMSGKVSDRDDLASKMVALNNPNIQSLAEGVILESKEGDFEISVVDKVLLALCHWKVDKKAVAQQIDFTRGLSYLTKLRSELPSVDKLPDLKQANFILNKSGEQIGEVYDREYIDRNGVKLLKKNHRRRSVKSSEIPDIVFKAFAAIEDKRFNSHNGFDFEALKRLYYASAQGSAQGGSTFTMQVIKNAFFLDDVEREREVGLRSLKRKIKETLTIPLVENRYSKNEILTYYLNLIDFLPKSQGIKMASIDLFGKENLFDLEIEEVALLAALPKGSSYYNPRRHPERAKLRRDTVLRVMMEQNIISKDLKEAAQLRPLKLTDKSVSDEKVQARHFTAHLTNLFTKLKNENKSDSRWAMGGLDVVSSLNSKLQKRVNTAVRNGLLSYEKSNGRFKQSEWLDTDTGLPQNISTLVERFDGDWPRAVRAKEGGHPYPETDWIVAAKISSSPRRWGLGNGEVVSVSSADRRKFADLKLYDLVLLEAVESEGLSSYRIAGGARVQAGVVVLDVKSGEVLALNGGFTAGAYGKYSGNNRATKSLRQPGSIVKPFSYLYALNSGVQPNTLLKNQAITFPHVPGCGFNWKPKNAGGGSGGNLTMFRALERSVNLSYLDMFLNLNDHEQNFDRSASSLYKTFRNLYDFTANLGAYPSWEQLSSQGRDKPCLPWLIGSYETTVVNMGQAYVSLANGGLKRPAIFLNEVLKDGQPLIVDKSEQKKKEVDQYRFALSNGLVQAPEAFGALKGLSPVAVTQVRTLLEGVVSDGTARDLLKWSGKVAGKTGTTNNSRDAWFAGFNSSIVIVVWTGYDTSKIYPNLGADAFGGSVALPIFKEIMEQYYTLYPDEAEKNFADPEQTPGVVGQLISLSSGRLVQDYQGRKCRSSTSSKLVYFSQEIVDTTSKLQCN